MPKGRKEGYEMCGKRVSLYPNYKSFRRDRESLPGLVSIAVKLI